MTPTERKAIDNGIWLCASCATLIDKDRDRYSPKLLRAWRLEAEDRAKATHGRRPPKETDAQETLIAAMTGRAREFVPTAIHNVHAASDSVLSALDDRIDVHTSFANGATKISLYPKEPVHFRALVDERQAARWEVGVNVVLREAREISLPLEGVRFEGSPLIEHMAQHLDEDASLTISPIGRPVVLKMATGEPAVSLDDVHGQLFVGQEIFRFEGSLYGSLIDFEISFGGPSIADQVLEPRLNLAFPLKSWAGRPIASLPYFEKVLDFVKAISDSKSFRANLEVEGTSLVRFKDLDLRDSPQFKNIEVYLYHYRRARLLANFCGVLLTASMQDTLSAAEVEELTRVAKVIEREACYGPEAFTKPPETTITVPSLDVLEREIFTSQACCMRQPSHTLIVLGTPVELPPQEILLLNSEIEILDKQPMPQKSGAWSVRLRFGFTPGFQCIYRFVQSPIRAKGGT